MKSTTSHKYLVSAILSGAYTPLDVREFVQLCYTLAVPLIRKKILRGKINLDIMRLKEVDIVYDCLADLFRHDEHGRFVEIETYFQRHGVGSGTIQQGAGEEFLVALRRLVFLKVNKNIIRLYSEVDPVLGKVLRNVKLAVEKTKLFREVDRFGETHLVVEGGDALEVCAPIPQELAEQLFTQAVLLHDTVVTMVKKLHSVLMEQDEFQRSIPLVGVALMVKKVYLLEWGQQEETPTSAEDAVYRQEIAALARQVCNTLGDRMHATYVRNNKMSDGMYKAHLRALNDIVLGEFDGQENVSYYEHLKRYVPKLSQRTYAQHYRTVLEYLAKTAKTMMREELRKQ